MKCLKATTLVSLAASVGALMAVSAPASAATLSSIRGGSECTYSSGAVPKVSAKGNLYNNSLTASSVVICPVYWDAQTLLLGVAGATVVVTDNSTGGNISCNLVHVTANGATEALGAADATTGASPTAQDLDLALPAGTLPAGNLMVRCTLGKKTGSSPVITAIEIYSGDPA